MLPTEVLRMKCLIIAAGKGSRLRLRGAGNPLIPISGVPLIGRVMRSALLADSGDASQNILTLGDGRGRPRPYVLNV